jgi:mRNA interferase MazF
MERFIKGDVVVISFPYTNLSEVKKRPALVVATLKGDNIILSQITSVKRPDDDLINLNKEDFESGYLNQNSFIIPSLIFTADCNNIYYKAGNIKQYKILEVQKKLCEIFTK